MGLTELVHSVVRNADRENATRLATEVLALFAGQARADVLLALATLGNAVAVETPELEPVSIPLAIAELSLTGLAELSREPSPTRGGGETCH